MSTVHCQLTEHRADARRDRPVGGDTVPFSQSCGIKQHDVVKDTRLFDAEVVNYTNTLKKDCPASPRTEMDRMEFAPEEQGDRILALLKWPTPFRYIHKQTGPDANRCHRYAGDAVTADRPSASTAQAPARTPVGLALKTV